MAEERPLAPAFSLKADDGSDVRLSDFRGKRVLVYFYPKADTPGCTKQACALRDVHPEVEDVDVVVIGISPDLPEPLARFREKYGLPFILLSDPDHAVAKAFGAWGEKKTYGKTYEGILRSHFAIDEEGRLLQTGVNVKPETTAVLARQVSSL